MADLFGPLPATQPPDALPAGQPRARGAYYTPDPLALAIARTLRDELHLTHIARIFEPGCGGGSFLRAANEVFPHAKLHGVDLLPACDGPGFVERRDLFDVRLFAEKTPGGPYSLVIGNPDFGIAERVVRHCLDLLEPHGYLAFLLRAAFLGSEGRVPLYREHPLRALQPIAQRPSFTGGGSDPMEYCLFVWQRGFSGRGEVLPPLVWR